MTVASASDAVAATTTPDPAVTVDPAAGFVSATSNGSSTGGPPDTAGNDLALHGEAVH